ncbi:hypothetical protein ATANTOWER_008561 [Ataeniobius toweri]|uniref:Transmembrane protein n=1 Tax=Ataeniobius toweri TaxID=208326 RepID=A0ABU7AZ19_9TELE|nr:hypothetical protein [Ataeniobius toweri]
MQPVAAGEEYGEMNEAFQVPRSPFFLHENNRSQTIMLRSAGKQREYTDTATNCHPVKMVKHDRKGFCLCFIIFFFFGRAGVARRVCVRKMPRERWRKREMEKISSRATHQSLVSSFFFFAELR